MTAQADAVTATRARRRGAVLSAARGLLWLAVLGLIGVTGCTMLARSWWLLDILTHVRVYYVAFALLLVIIALLQRQFAASCIAVVCGGVHAVWLMPLFLSPSIAASDIAGRDIRLATINMYMLNQTPERVMAALDRYQPDIVSLQETTPWWPEAPDAILDAYPYRAPMTWDLGRSVTLISRFPIVDHQMWNGGGLQLQFPVLTVDIDGQLVTVIAVHPPHPLRRVFTEPRANYWNNLREAIQQAPRPAIVLGDFNATPFSPVFEDLLAETGLRNAANGFGYLPTWPDQAGPFGIPIDHVLLSREFGVAAVEVGPEIGSDHAPLFVDVRLAAEAAE